MWQWSVAVDITLSGGGDVTQDESVDTALPGDDSLTQALDTELPSDGDVAQ